MPSPVGDHPQCPGITATVCGLTGAAWRLTGCCGSPRQSTGIGNEISLVSPGRRNRCTALSPSRPTHKYEESEEIERRSGLFPAGIGAAATSVKGLTGIMVFGATISVEANETYNLPWMESQTRFC